MTLYKFAKGLLSGIYRVLYRIHVVGEENIPESGGVVIAANHTSAADPIVLGIAARRQISFIAKAELFRIPIIGPILRVLGAFPVNRNEGDVAALKKSLAVLSCGGVLCVFPQGTRCPGVPVRDTADCVKSGVGLMAMRSGACVIPVAIRTKANRVRMFRRTDIIFGSVISYETISGFEGRTKYSDAAAFIFGQICDLSEGNI